MAKIFSLPRIRRNLKCKKPFFYLCNIILCPRDLDLEELRLETLVRKLSVNWGVEGCLIVIIVSIRTSLIGCLVFFIRAFYVSSLWPYNRTQWHSWPLISCRSTRTPSTRSFWPRRRSFTRPKGSGWSTNATCRSISSMSRRGWRRRTSGWFTTSISRPSGNLSTPSKNRWLVQKVASSYLGRGCSERSRVRIPPSAGLFSSPIVSTFHHYGVSIIGSPKERCISMKNDVES